MTSTRKGLRNQFKALLGLRKPGSLSPETARPVTANGSYDNSSPEGQLRQLGDLAFMLQDYETAASSYQLLAPDLKADRAWRQFAATQVPSCQAACRATCNSRWAVGAGCLLLGCTALCHAVASTHGQGATRQMAPVRLLNTSPYLHLLGQMRRLRYHLYATQEVLALTLVVAGGKPSEIASHFKEAFQRYTTASGTRAPRSGVRAATRTMLLLADYCRGLGHHGEANYALMKAHFQACALPGQSTLGRPLRLRSHADARRPFPRILDEGWHVGWVPTLS